MMKKKGIWVLAVLLLVLLCGCERTPAFLDSSGEAQGLEENTASAGEEERVVLRFFHYQGEAKEAYEKVFRAYEEAHPNVTIESEFMNTTSYNSTLSARIAVQDCADIFGVHPGLRQAIPLAKAGYMVDLSGQKCLENISESNLQTAAYGGKYYAVPTDFSYICTFYNKDIFAQYDLEVPTTWDQFLETCRVLRDAGITPISLCYKDTWIQSLIPYSLAATTIYKENPAFDQQMREGDKKFYGPEWTETMEKLVTLFTNGYVTPEYMQTSYDQQLQAFARGDAAMMVMGTWAVSLVRGLNESCNLGLFIMPASDDGVNWIASSVGGMLAVNAESAHKEIAIDFLNFFLSNDAVYSQFLLDTGNLPARTNGDFALDTALRDLTSDIPGSYPFLDVNWSGDMASGFLKAVEDISSGGDISEALDTLDQIWEEAYEADETRSGG